MCFTSISWGHQICCPGPPHWISRWPPWLVWTILGSKLLGGPLPIFRYQWLVGRFIEFKNCSQINFSACISCPFAVTANNVLGLPKLFSNVTVLDFRVARDVLHFAFISCSFYHLGPNLWFPTHVILYISKIAKEIWFKDGCCLKMCIDYIFWECCGSNGLSVSRLSTWCWCRGMILT